MNFLLIFLGGGLGALSRFGLSKLITSVCGTEFPLGILLCNLVGCFSIGFVTGFIQKGLPDWIGPFLLIGFLGSFTTFSTFANDSYLLLSNGQSGLGILNIVASILPGLIAVWAGLSLAN